MNLYAPSYYKRFKCIADRCKNSCCIDWEIDVDEKTYEKYLSVGGYLKENIAESEGCRYFELKNGRCPHLLDNGLCRIIIDYGEDYIADICRDHPRFYNCISERREVGLGLVCEEAARMIIGDDELFSLEKIGDCDDEPNDCDFDALPERDDIISLILESDKTLPVKIKMLENKYSINVNIHSMNEWFGILTELEILDKKWEEILNSATVSERKHDCCELYPNLERILVYFVYRHVSASSSYLNLRAKLGFSILSVKILVYLIERAQECNVENLIGLARIYSSEIEYSEENTDALIYEFESELAE